MPLTKISTDGVKDDAIDASKLPANSVGASELADNAVDTNAIADQAVALSKLPHGDGSSDGKFLRANNGADPSFESIPAGTTINNNAANRLITGSGTANTLNGESNAIIDSSGHMGLGVTPNTNLPSNADFKFLQVGTGASLFGRGSGDEDRGGIAVNYYHTGSAEKYLGNGNSSGIILGDGDIDLFTAGSNSSGANAAMSKTIAMRIDSSGRVGINTSSPAKRLDVIGDIRTSTGILFGSDTAAANALDDYEEGTWTPTFDGNAATNTSNNCRYIKIGNVVHCFFRATHPTTSSSSYATITGLPFTSVGFAVGVPGGAFAETNAGANLSMIVNPNGTYAYILKCDDSGVAVVTQSSISGKDFRGCITYHTS